MNSLQIRHITWLWNRIRISYGMGTFAIGYSADGSDKDTMLFSIVNVPVFQARYEQSRQLKETIDAILAAAEEP